MRGSEVYPRQNKAIEQTIITTNILIIKFLCFLTVRIAVFLAFLVKYLNPNNTIPAVKTITITFINISIYIKSTLNSKYSIYLDY